MNNKEQKDVWQQKMKIIPWKQRRKRFKYELDQKNKPFSITKT